MTHATLAPTPNERRFGVIGMSLRAILAQFVSRRDAHSASQTPGAMSERDLADIGHARGMISGTTQQTTESR
ncbi:hypothetical protein [Sedimentitalea todarodis]|uniref:DUF1127 domain-containing protein n=1 Tax=Sedimentitalea todarodis TaxID=1631240 RepID=A0ABU3VG71_9RHOB|nr:hypothetical protein [Sedimentitalea todarodis]MDU9005184.1 hypothetical protein [Sedimentitalea todarodis]